MVEFASMEAKNQTKDLKINFKGEITSQGTDFMDDKVIEALTPDYTVFYTFAGQTQNYLQRTGTHPKGQAGYAPQGGEV